MPVFIKGVRPLNDPWVFVETPLDDYREYPWFSVVPLHGLADKSQWPLMQTWIGAWFEVDVEYSLLSPSVLELPLLNMTVTSYADGRVFTLAQHLKSVLGFRGELRVSGNFLIDQMALLRECGVDGFLLPDDSDIEHALFILKQTPARTF